MGIETSYYYVMYYIRIFTIFINLIFQIQMEADTSFLTIYNGGSAQAEIISYLNGAINDIKISTPRNQIFVVLNGNNNTSIRLNAAVIASK